MARRRRNPTPTGRWRKPFLAALAKEGVITEAAERAGVTRTYVYFVRDNDPEFAAAWDEALEEATDGLLLCAVKRGKKKSDKLLMFLLAAHRPNVYSQRLRLEHRGGVEMEVVEEIVDAAAHAETNGQASPGAGRLPPQ